MKEFTKSGSGKIILSRRKFLKAGAIAGSVSLLPWGITRAMNHETESARQNETLNNLDSIGLLDITKAPYMADPQGIKDSTAAIQKAVNDARDQGLVCFFPEGTYLISDMISCEQTVEKLESPKNVDGGTQHYWPLYRPMVLKGSVKGKRPVIKLAPGAKGFDDPANPKIAIWIWAQTWFDAPGKQEPVWGIEQGNISFNHFFIDIDIDIRGHAGAIGLRHAGSQGSAMFNSTIYADGAYSGLSNCCGQGGGTYNFEVIGGDYGIMIDTGSRFPILTSCTFSGQKKAAISYSGNSISVPTMLVGCHLKSESGILVDMSTSDSYEGLILIDSVVEMTKDATLVKVKKNENIFIENSYLRGVNKLTSLGSELSEPGSWTLIERFSSHTERGINMVNGENVENGLLSLKSGVAAPDYRKIHDLHFSALPSFEDPKAANVKDYGAVGDGTTDDTEAFRKAITTSDLVFVPKGNFKISDNLILGENTTLFGLTRSFTSITTGSSGRRMTGDIDSSALNGNQENIPSIITPDSREAKPGLFLISLRGLNVEWKSGKGTWMLTSGSPKFSSNSGGRFYGLGAMGKQFVMDGLTVPFYFYAMNVERVVSNPQSEIRNCKNITVYYFKVESGTIQPGSDLIGKDANTPCRISNSENIKIYCMFGNVKGLGDRPMLDVENTRELMVCQLKAFNVQSFPHIRESIAGKIVEIPSSKTISLFVRN